MWLRHAQQGEQHVGCYDFRTPPTIGVKLQFPPLPIVRCREVAFAAVRYDPDTQRG